MFDLVFVLDPSLKSIFAKNESCRSFNPLQLLFWPNFMLPYEIWSFSGSNWSQNHSNESTVRAPVFSLFCPYRHRRPSTPASSSTRCSSRRSSASGRRPYPLASTGTFSSLPAVSFFGARSSSSEQRRVRAVVVHRTGQGSPPHFDSSRSHPLHLAPKLVHPPTSAAEPLPSPNRAQTPSTIAVPVELRHRRRAPFPGHPPPQIDPR